MKNMKFGEEYVYYLGRDSGAQAQQETAGARAGEQYAGQGGVSTQQGTTHLGAMPAQPEGNGGTASATSSRGVASVLQNTALQADPCHTPPPPPPVTTGAVQAAVATILDSNPTLNSATVETLLFMAQVSGQRLTRPVAQEADQAGERLADDQRGGLLIDLTALDKPIPAAASPQPEQPGGLGILVTTNALEVLRTERAAGETEGATDGNGEQGEQQPNGTGDGGGEQQGT